MQGCGLLKGMPATINHHQQPRVEAQTAIVMRMRRTHQQGVLQIKAGHMMKRSEERWQACHRGVAVVLVRGFLTLVRTLLATTPCQICNGCPSMRSVVVCAVHTRCMRHNHLDCHLMQTS
jgi:hypothetical protein